MTYENSPDNQDEIQRQLAALQSRMDNLERGIMPGGNLPRTSLLSDNFLKRAFTVWGHNFVAGFIIAAPIWLAAILLMAVLGGFR